MTLHTRVVRSVLSWIDSRPKMVPEATFTAPRPDCRHPEWWHATDDQSTECEVTILIAGMVRALQPEFVLETGACLGNTAEAIGKALHENGHGALVTLESEPSLAAAALRRCRRLPVSVVHASSLDYVPHRPIDFAFFDSLVRLRIAEFERFRPWMHTQTVVAFHDTGPQHDLRRRLSDLERRGLLVAPLYLPTPRGVMFACPAG